jgi:hypothetical protein
VSGGCGVLRFPIPRQKLADPLGRMIGKSGEHVGEPCARINVVELGCLDQRVDGGGAPAAVVRRGLIVPGFRRRKSQSPNHGRTLGGAAGHPAGG